MTTDKAESKKRAGVDSDARIALSVEHPLTRSGLVRGYRSVLLSATCFVAAVVFVMWLVLKD